MAEKTQSNPVQPDQTPQPEQQNTGPQFVMQEKEASAKKIHVRCHKCGEQEYILWNPGMSCPICGSSSFEPIIKVEIDESQQIDPTTHVQVARKSIQFKMPDIPIMKVLTIGGVIFMSLVWLRIGWLVYHEKYSKKPGPPPDYGWKYVCSVCDHSFVDKPRIPPVDCPLCGRQEAYVLYKCLSCKKRFVLLKKDRTPQCTHCHSTLIKPYQAQR